MTDKELSTFGERLYNAILLTPLPAGTIFGIGAAIRQNVSWRELPRTLKFAIFKIAAQCAPDALDDDGVQEEAGGGTESGPAPAEAPAPVETTVSATSTEAPTPPNDENAQTVTE